MSGPYTEGWLHENPDDPEERSVTTVQLPHVVVSDELLERARTRFYAAWQEEMDLDRIDASVDAAVDAVAGELWQAGYNAGFRLGRREGLLGDVKAGPVNTTHQQHDTPRPAPPPFGGIGMTDEEAEAFTRAIEET